MDALRDLGRFDEALVASEKAIACDPNNWRGWNGKALILKQLKRYDDALTTYKQIVTLEPSVAQVWMDMSSVLRALGHHEEALKAEERAHAIRNASPPLQIVQEPLVHTSKEQEVG